MKDNWIQLFAQAAVPIITRSIGSSRTVAEITQGHGMFSQGFLGALDQSVELFRTDSPMQDYNAFAVTAPSQTLKSTRWVPGSIFRQLYPSNSMDFIYVFQAFNQPSQPITTSDHLIPSLSKNELTRLRVSKSQEADLQHLLLLRYQELKPGKNLVFDLILQPDPSEAPYSWDCLDLAVRMARQSIAEEHQNSLNLQTAFRDLSEVKKVLIRLEKLFSIEDFEEKSIVLPAFQEFSEKNNLEDYLSALVSFWKRPLWMMAQRVFKTDQVKSAEFFEKVMKNFTKICRDMKPLSVQKLLTVRLKKIEASNEKLV